MKYSAIFCLLLVLTQSMNLRKNYAQDNMTPIDRLRKIKDVSAYASNMISNVELHLQTGGKVDEVIQFVKEALSDS